MKILSKHSEYYDQMVHVYGQDPLLIYDRRNCRPVNDFGSNLWIFAICGEFVPIIKAKNGKTYSTREELLDLVENVDGKALGHRFWFRKGYWGNPKKNVDDFISYWESKTKGLNERERKPVLMRGWNEWIEPMGLSSFDVNKYIDAQEMYEKISAFLGWLNDNPPIPDNQTDKEKVKSHGFDLKTSFRHKKA